MAATLTLRSALLIAIVCGTATIVCGTVNIAAAQQPCATCRSGRGLLAPRQDPYAACYWPNANHYVVVEPQPATMQPAFCRSQHGWTQQPLVANPYPYGWFGARMTSQPSRRGSYYGDRLDFVQMRPY